MPGPGSCARAVLLLAVAGGCGDDLRFPAAAPGTIYSFANQCVAVGIIDRGRYLVGDGEDFEVVGRTPEKATRFLLRPSDLGTYLLFDQDSHYLVSDGAGLQRSEALRSDTGYVDGLLSVDDDFISEGEWELEALATGEDTGFRLRHRRSGGYITASGAIGDEASAARIGLFPRTDCAEFPELTVDAEGAVSPPVFDDGSVFGFVDAHSHLFTNLGFGGGGVFHGAPFHRLGVEHALPSCELTHGSEGRKDLLGYFFDADSDIPAEDLIAAALAGRTPDFNHDTSGYPEFRQWPDAYRSGTHQTQYYKWLERAYLSGLRLMVQHATTNQVLCEMFVGIGTQPLRHSCNDMVAVDRIIDDTYRLERYIDAQHGGPGLGWFRIVTSPEQAREVIADGKLAVLLGIETSNLFDCVLSPPAGAPTCDQAYVTAKLDEYYDKGVRVLFPAHKFDNAFAAGDGHKGIIELGNFVQTGHYSNFGPCDETVTPNLDQGAISFPNLNSPREEYDSAAPNDLSGFADDPIGTLFPFIGLLDGGPLAGDYCQQAGLTALGEFLVQQIMARGMILEVDHLSRLGRKRALELLVENDYPASGSHGNNSNGQLYALGGVSKSSFRHCRSETETATMDDRFQQRIQQMRDNGAFPAEGFAFDQGGLANGHGPRFGEDSDCTEPQSDPVTYPFTSYAGDITFHAPQAGHRAFDFNTEGMVHIGLVAEMIEDVRGDGVSDADLEPLFKSAEGYLRMWEKAIRRGAALSD